jgi:hypothetical protein
MHKVGKIGIPDAMGSTGPLEPDERAQKEQHTRIGSGQTSTPARRPRWCRWPRTSRAATRSGDGSVARTASPRGNAAGRAHRRQLRHLRQLVGERPYTLRAEDRCPDRLGQLAAQQKNMLAPWQCLASGRRARRSQRGFVRPQHVGGWAGSARLSCQAQRRPLGVAFGRRVVRGSGVPPATSALPCANRSRPKPDAGILARVIADASPSSRTT